MEYTHSNSSPWTNVALAVAQQSSVAKLASPRIIERWGLSKENITACPARSWKQKAAKSPDRPRSSAANFHTGIQTPTLLSPAADPLSSDARSPSQLRRMCRVVCEKPGCRRQSSVAVCDAARGVWRGRGWYEGGGWAWSNQDIGMLGGCRRARSRGAAVGSGMQKA